MFDQNTWSARHNFATAIASEKGIEIRATRPFKRSSKNNPVVAGLGDVPDMKNRLRGENPRQFAKKGLFQQNRSGTGSDVRKSNCG